MTFKQWLSTAQAGHVRAFAHMLGISGATTFPLDKLKVRILAAEKAESLFTDEVAPTL